MTSLLLLSLLKMESLVKIPKILLAGTLDPLLGLKLFAFSQRMEHNVRNISL